MTLPPEALARVERRLADLQPGEGAEIVIKIDAFRHKNGTLKVTADLDLSERYSHSVQLSLDAVGT